MIRLSPSSLQYFFESKCPAAWKYSQAMRPKEKDEFAERGVLVHSLMEGATKENEVEDTKALLLYHKLIDIKNLLGLEILEKEVWINTRIMPGVEWVGRVDALAKTVHGSTVLLDYKTIYGGGWKWSENTPYKAVFWPQALSFQATGYTLPQLGRKWPRELWFLIAGLKGPAYSIPYVFDKEDYKNLLDAVSFVKKAKEFPKVRGKQCLSRGGTNKPCEYLDVCFKLKGWEEKYDFRE